METRKWKWKLTRLPLERVEVRVMKEEKKTARLGEKPGGAWQRTPR